MKLNLKALFLVLLGSLLSCPLTAAPQIETPGFFITTIGSSVRDIENSDRQFTDDGLFVGLQRVSAVAFAKEVDVAFVVEKAGLIRVIVDDVTQIAPVVDMRDQVNDYVDSGMGGIAVHPEFPDVKEILISFTHDTGVNPKEGFKYARVARLQVREEIADDGTVQYFADPPTDDDVIIGKLSETEEFPSCNDRPLGADCGAVDFAAHSFTFVQYGPDGKIYIGTGDGAGYFKPEPHALYAQINSHLSGKVLRVNPDGTAPDDNPFFTGNENDNESKIFAKGLRNPKSGSFDPVTGKLCVGNVGWFLNEGIYCLSPGDNAGWPCRENGPAFNGYQNVSLSRDGERLASCPLDPTTYIEPDYTYAHKLVDFDGELLPIGAVIGCARPTADEYPDSIKGTCVYGDYVFDTIETVSFGADTVGNPSSIPLLSGAGNPTDLTTDRHGRICYSAYNTGVVDGIPVSEIRCLGYNDDGSVPLLPVPSFSSLAEPADPSSIMFDASASYHPGGAELVYSWDFGDGNSAGNQRTASHVYEQPGDYEVTLTAVSVGSTVERSTFQRVNVADPVFVTPIVPSVVGVWFKEDDHQISSPVEFSARVRNDLGTDGFRVLANIYNPAGAEVAHIVRDEVFVVQPGETLDIKFRWDQATDLGEHTIAIEFYAEDWESWTLKYPNTQDFFVRNRAVAGAGVVMLDEPAPEPEPENPEPGVIADDDPMGPEMMAAEMDAEMESAEMVAANDVALEAVEEAEKPQRRNRPNGFQGYGCSVLPAKNGSKSDPMFGFLLLATAGALFIRRRDG